MAFEIIMPKMGESIVEGTILEWKKSIGDFVAKDEILLEISTDKVDSEIPSSYEGTLIEIYYNKNDVVEVGKVIALIGDSDEKVDLKKTVSKKDDDENNKTEKIDERIQQVDSNNLKSSKKSCKKFYSPLVRSIAKKEGIDLNSLDDLSGSGLNGRVNKEDVLAFVHSKGREYDGSEKQIDFDSSNNVDPGRVETVSHVRKMISEHMLKSLKTSAHVYSSVEVDVTPIVEYVKLSKDSFYKKNSIKLTYTPFFLEACIEALKQFPMINASFIDDAIHYHENINLGVAVALPDDNLIVPVIKYAEEKNFLGLLRSTSRLAEKARNASLSPEEVQGSTFTLTNPGVFGSLFGMGIINQPNVAILSTGAIEKKPVVKETEYGDSIFIRSIMYMTLGYDHRIIDGAYGSKFLVFIKKYLESIDLERDI